MNACRHPKETRSLLAGYDVVCGECDQIIGRVALFPCAVLSPPAIEALLAVLPEATTSMQRMARSNLEQALRAGVPA